jgi:beta-lactamase class A
MKRKILFTLFFIAILCLGMIIGFSFEKKNVENGVVSEDQSQQLRLGYDTSKLINPLLACNIGESSGYEELKPLKQKLEKLTSQQKSNGLTERVSVYYRSLNDGHWTGINEDDEFVPASLIKVPLLIAYMKMAESDPKILDQEYTYDAEDKDENQGVQKPPTPFIKGKAYTVRELLFRMIAYSGNNSHLVLAQHVDPSYLIEVYTDLGLSHSDFSQANITNNSVSPKAFSTFLRILYNASYLNHEYSQQALQLMVDSTFNDGLVAGLPSYIKVAHKFGERTIIDNSKINKISFRELHDCGIVYYPSNPYLLCVMTQGDDFNNLKTVIKDISQTVYEDVAKNN